MDRQQGGSGAYGDQETGTTRARSEVSLTDAFRRLWCHKVIIILGTLIPTALVAAVLLTWPRRYGMTITYPLAGMDEASRQIAVSQFYSQDNFPRILNGWRQNGFTKHADSVARVWGRDAYATRRYVDLRTWSDPSTDVDRARSLSPEEAARLAAQKFELLLLTVTSQSRQDLPQISRVVRDNVEDSLQLYAEREYLRRTVWGLRAQLADIERQRYDPQLRLATEQAVLARLAAYTPPPPPLPATKRPSSSRSVRPATTSPGSTRYRRLRRASSGSRRTSPRPRRDSPTPRSFLRSTRGFSTIRPSGSPPPPPSR